MASEIKINLATYLKDDGIKAARQQVTQLSQEIKNVNKQTQQSTNESIGAIGKLPGAIGKLQSSIQGFGAQAMAVFAAFKVGCDIGEWLVKDVIDPLVGYEDISTRIIRKNKEIEKQAKAAADEWAESLKIWESSWDKAIAGAEKAKTAIEDATQAYLKMQAARERVQAASNNAEMLGLERDKFNAMAGAASPEEAAALGKQHDILIAEAKAKQDMAKFDRAAETELHKIEQAEEALLKARDKSVYLKREMYELDKKIALIDNQDAADYYGLEKSDEMLKQLQTEKAALQSKIDAANRDVKRRQGDKDAAKLAASALAEERANAEARANYDIEQKQAAYDEYLAYVEAQEAKAAEEAWQREQQEIARAVAAEQAAREKMERELAQQRIADIRTELSAAQQAQSAAQNRASAANAGLSAAWGLYRNKDAMQARIDEAKAQQAAEAQWEKDFERLKFRRTDWRTAEFGSLSASDESIRQVALAKEEKAAADKAVLETAENTRDLAEKLDELLLMK